MQEEKKVWAAGIQEEQLTLRVSKPAGLAGLTCLPYLCFLLFKSIAGSRLK